MKKIARIFTRISLYSNFNHLNKRFRFLNFFIIYLIYFMTRNNLQGRRKSFLKDTERRNKLIEKILSICGEKDRIKISRKIFRISLIFTYLL